MIFKITIEDNNHLKKFFKYNSKYKEIIINNINNTLPMLIEEKPYKIKTAHGLKYNNKIIYEYKIHLDKHLDCRVAYTQESENINVFFISNIIIKAHFVKLLEQLDCVK